MKLLRKFKAASNADRWLLIKASLLVTGIRLGLWLGSYRTVQNVLIRTSTNSIRPVDDASRLTRRVVWAVRAVARRTLGDKPCLVQAMAAKWFLDRSGLNSELRIGVAKNDDGEFEAHAWLDQGATTIIGRGTSHMKYQVLEPISRAG